MRIQIQDTNVFRHKWREYNLVAGDDSRLGKLPLDPYGVISRRKDVEALEEPRLWIEHANAFCIERRKVNISVWSFDTTIVCRCIFRARGLARCTITITL